MWIIGMAICIGLLFAGHEVMNSGQGSHLHASAPVREQATETAPIGAAAEAAPKSAPQPDPGHRR